jgi:hypothetical protein
MAAKGACSCAKGAGRCGCASFHVLFLPDWLIPYSDARAAGQGVGTAFCPPVPGGYVLTLHVPNIGIYLVCICHRGICVAQAETRAPPGRRIANPEVRPHIREVGFALQQRTSRKAENESRV